MSVQEPDTVYTALAPPDSHPGFHYAGHVKLPGFQAFPVDVIWERDVAITMRDGVKLYTDIFRPESAQGQVPAIIPWGPYGKVGTSTLNYDDMGPWWIGILYQHLSGYKTFERSNPAEWCSKGYAVVDINARGCGNSEGDIMFWGEQEATDIYDSITWVTQQPWCNGSVLNFVSRFNHPNLKAIAPWEGLTDPYGQQFCRGGIPRPALGDLIIKGFAGRGRAENPSAMIKARPLFDNYWEEKGTKPENIRDVLMYLTASYSNLLHSECSFHTFKVAQTSLKWLRVHASQEWHYLYQLKASDDLQRFFDFYAKGIQNGWEKDTPRVRLSLLGYDSSYSKTVVGRPEQQWPPARQRLGRYYLDAASQSLAQTKANTASQAIDKDHSLSDSSDFVLYFDKYTEICGRPFVKLYMSCDAADDFNVVVQIRKISSSGEPLESLNWSPMPKPRPDVPNVNVAKHLGPQGMLRTSHHVSLRPRQCEDEVPQYDHNIRQPITPGVVTPLLIPIWPVGIVFEASEGLMLRVTGHDMALPETEALRLNTPIDENIGMHSIHTGGQHESYLVIPMITN
ncbi:Alpha/Beta hydrolase protein [Aspergillus aurantiobrunneus]